MLILGLDTSLTHLGFAVARWNPPELEWLEVGCFVTEPAPKRSKVSRTDDNRNRVMTLAAELRSVVKKHGRPDLIAVEALALPFGKTSLVAVSATGRVRGLVDALAIELLVPVVEVQPMALKHKLTGENTASKEDVQNALLAKFPRLRVMLPQLLRSNQEHAADACGTVVFAVEGGFEAIEPVVEEPSKHDKTERIPWEQEVLHEAQAEC